MEHRSLLSFLLLISLLGLSDAIGRHREHPPASPPRFAEAMKAELDLSYEFSIPGTTPFVRFVVVLPKSIEGRQEILNVRFSPQPQGSFRKNGNDYAQFIFFEPEKKFEVKINIKAVLFRYDLSIARTRPQIHPADRSALKDFLKNENFVEKDDPFIQQIASGIKAGSDVDIVKGIYGYVVKNVNYSGYNNKDLGALYAARQKKGDCTEYADLFAALCRARDIPARVVDGYTAVSHNTPAHTWVEVYLDKYGWVPFDPAFGDVQGGPPQPFDLLGPIYVHFSHVRNDDALNNYHFSSYYYHGDKITVTDSAKVKASVINERTLR